MKKKETVTKATEKAKTQVEKKPGYVPPPPADGLKISPPAGMPAVKLFPISSEAPPSVFKFPNIESAAPAPPAADGGGAGGAAEPVDDGFTPEERRKNELEEDPGFKKYKMMHRNRIPLILIRDRIEADGVYKTSDIDLFATALEIKEADEELKLP